MVWLLVAGLGLAVVASSGAAGKTYLLEVQGLSCPFCAYGLEKKLKKLDGVNSVSIDLKSGEVELSADRELTREQVEKAVKKAGFRLGAFRERVPASGPGSG